MVWDETIRIVMELFNDVWGDRKEIVLDDVLDATMSVGTKHIACRCSTLVTASDYPIHHQCCWIRKTHLLDRGY
jgi:hypothetical protein